MINCLEPHQAYICGTILTRDGVISPNIVFSYSEASEYFTRKHGTALGFMFMEQNKIDIPCGKCLPCQIQKRKTMTARLHHEMSLYGSDCCFLTLTYDDDHIPRTDRKPLDSPDKKISFRHCGYDGSVFTLLPYDVQKFMKRLRRHLEYLPKSPKRRIGRDHVTSKIRYFAVGEYGTKTHRPHYHIMIFGWLPSDLRFHCSRKGNAVYRSAQVEKLWPFGFSTVQSCGTGVSKYVARYVTKKFTSTPLPNVPSSAYISEFFLQSCRHGGIGVPWFAKYWRECISRNYTTYKLGNHVIKQSIPKIYQTWLRRMHRNEWLKYRDAKILYLRTHTGKTNYDDLLRRCDKFLHDNKANDAYDLL